MLSQPQWDPHSIKGTGGGAGLPCLLDLRPFPECRRLSGHFGGACGNCKWRDHAIRYSVRDDGDAVEVIEIPDTDDEGDNGGRRLRTITDGSTSSFAILIE
ncbi:hypothetical protein ACJ73_03181 [Blastomyces percursus]|uniref:Uncharacterized protein n=1 Tax=Blastomyces percursus TaxID=1658174 RepID=A0A1J9QA89_9EURO|nr:hypothetical protein ACJ73_03181 [Blastomyces percursus]